MRHSDGVAENFDGSRAAALTYRRDGVFEACQSLCPQPRVAKMAAALGDLAGAKKR
jgi:hypothetical protein